MNMSLIKHGKIAKKIFAAWLHKGNAMKEPKLPDNPTPEEWTEYLFAREKYEEHCVREEVALRQKTFEQLMKLEYSAWTPKSFSF